MAAHVWNGSAWKTIDEVGDVTPIPGSGEFSGVKVWNGSAWVDIVNISVWNGSAWKGFLDDTTMFDHFIIYGGPFETEQVQWFISSTNGQVAYTDSNGNTSDQFEWIRNSSNSGQYEIKVDIVSGGPFAAFSSPTGTWLSLSSSHIWNLESSNGIANNITFDVNIRHATTLQIVATGQVFMSVDSQSSGGEIPL